MADLDAGDLVIPGRLGIDVQQGEISEAGNSDDVGLVCVGLLASVNIEDVDEDSVGSCHDITLEVGGVNSVDTEWPSVDCQGVVWWGQDQTCGGDDDVLGDEETVAALVARPEVLEKGQLCDWKSSGIGGSGEDEFRVDTDDGGSILAVDLLSG